MVGGPNSPGSIVQLHVYIDLWKTLSEVQLSYLLFLSMAQMSHCLALVGQAPLREEKNNNTSLTANNRSLRAGMFIDAVTPTAVCFLRDLLSCRGCF